MTATEPTDSGHADELVKSSLDNGDDRPLVAKQRHPFWVAFSVCYLLFSVFALLMPLPVHGRVWFRIADLLHIPAFGVLNFLVLLIVRQHSVSPWRMPILVTALTITLSGLLEIAQGLLSRYASLDDLFRNALGAIASLLIFKSLEYRQSDHKRLGRVLIVAAFAVVVIATIPPTASIVDVYRQTTQFPVLASFSSRAELQRWWVSSARMKRKPIKWLDGTFALQVEYFPGKFPDIQLQELQRDWTQYRTLATELTHSPDSPSETVVIQLRIADHLTRGDWEHALSDRIELKRGESIDWRFNFKAAQETLEGKDRIRLENIIYLEFMAVELEKQATVQFGKIRLEP